MGMRGAFRVAACVHMSLRRGATLGDIGTLTLVTPSSPEKLKGHVQSPAADYSATPVENPVDPMVKPMPKTLACMFNNQNSPRTMRRLS